MKLYSYKEHFLELKYRVIRVIVFFFLSFFTSYYFSSQIFTILLSPLVELLGDSHKIIYTGMAEAFVTYLKLAAYSGLFLTIPYLALQIYFFISPGLFPDEKKIIGAALATAPVLFFAGGAFVFYIVMPKAWQFFLGFENFDNAVPIILQARVSEYLSLAIGLIMAFGFAFQLPIIMIICNMLGVVSSRGLRKKRRFAIVIIFVAAAIFTPPDVLSQFALALPLMALYELSILLCKSLENRGKSNVGYKMD